MARFTSMYKRINVKRCKKEEKIESDESRKKESNCFDSLGLEPKTMCVNTAEGCLNSKV